MAKLLKTHAKGGKHRNLIRSARNKEMGVYVKQAIRTNNNKAKHYRKDAQLKKVADAKRAAMHEWNTIKLCWLIKK